MNFGQRVLTLVAALGTSSSIAFAQTPKVTSGVRLSWARAEGAARCPSASALEREVAHRLGYSPFGGEASQVIEGLVTVEQDRYLAKLYERDAVGNTLGARQIADTLGDCRNLGEAVSLAIALIVDPNASLVPLNTANNAADAGSRAVSAPTPLAPFADSPPLPSSPSAAVAPVALNSVTSKTPVDLAAPVRQTSTASLPLNAPTVDRAVKTQHQSGSVWVLPAFRRGLFPKAVYGVEFAVEAPLLEKWPLSYRLGMLFLPEHDYSHSLSTLRSQAVKLGYGMTAGVAELCLKGRGFIRGFGCAGIEGGALHTVVHDPSPFEPGDRAWVAARVELGGEVTVVGPLLLQLRLLGATPLSQWTFRVKVDGEPSTLYDQPYFELGGSLGLGLRIP